MTEQDRPSIAVNPDGPYLVRSLEHLQGPNGPLENRATVALCRCGASAKKPFCDGAHARVEFSGANEADSTKDVRESFIGAQITVHDNRSVCAHAGVCTEGLAAVFRQKQEPWIDPDGATAAEIIDIVRRCPSGALSYSIGDTEHREREAAGEGSIFVVPRGPYAVSGAPALPDMPRGTGAAEGHFTLCRCGASKNKPFCDGTHWNVDFDGEGG